jgi:hypothetical protein
MFKELWHFLGLDNVAGFAYAFWSGSGSVIIPPLITLAGLIVIYWWHNNCHEPGCPLIGKHVIDGTRWCHLHHHHARKNSKWKEVPRASCTDTSERTDDLHGQQAATDGPT